MKKQKRAFSVFFAVFLVAAALGAYAQKSREVPSQTQVPPPHILLCPDINVVSLTARLVRTSTDAAGNQWDHVRLEATLQNDGGLAIPSGTMLQSKWYRNEIAIYQGTPANGIKAPGSRWTESFSSAFRHGEKTAYTYLFLSIRGMRECKTTNNQAVFAINETALHAGVALRR